MFITCTAGYDRDGAQTAKGMFIMLMQTESQSKPLRVIVRSCSMSQCGCWMMGSVRIKDQSITVSGSYGSDGLPKTVSDDIYNLGVELPQDLYDAWNNGGGWNSAGSEASSIRQWAIDNVLSNSQRASMKRRYDYKG